MLVSYYICYIKINIIYKNIIYKNIYILYIFFENKQNVLIN